MKKLLSTAYPGWAFNIAMLILRIAGGVLMIPHGYNKLVHFEEKRQTFMNFLGMSSTVSLGMVVFAEFFCAAMLVMGLFTRLFSLPLVIAMGVALFKAHNSDVFGDGQEAALYLACYTAILLCGPGKASVDGIMGK